MDIMQILPWAIFGFITCVVLVLMSVMSTRKSRAVERLEELRDPTLRDKERLGKEKNGMAAALEMAAPSLSQAIAPKSEVEKNHLKMRLANAGFNNSNAASLFLTIKVISLGVGVAMGGGVGVGMYGMQLNSLTALLIGGGVGFEFSAAMTGL